MNLDPVRARMLRLVMGRRGATKAMVESPTSEEQGAETSAVQLKRTIDLQGECQGGQGRLDLGQLVVVAALLGHLRRKEAAGMRRKSTARLERDGEGHVSGRLQSHGAAPFVSFRAEIAPSSGLPCGQYCVEGAATARCRPRAGTHARMPRSKC